MWNLKNDTNELVYKTEIDSAVENKLMETVKLKGGEGNGTPLQYSCLESPMDGGAW